jgi:predicted permease
MNLLDEILTDARFALRMLIRNPGFAVAAICSLALGIGGATAIFTLIDAIVLRSLPIAESEQLYIAEQRGATGDPYTRVSWSVFDHARRELAGRAEICATTNTTRMLLGSGERGGVPGEMGRVQLVSGECFTTLRQAPERGRLITPADDRVVDGHPVAVISDGYWTRRFARADVLGQPLTVNGVPMTIIGVTAPGFFGTSIDASTDVWVPVAMQHAVRYAGNVSNEDESDLRSAWVPQPTVAWLTLFLRIPDSQATARTAEQLHAILQRSFSERESYRTNDAARRRYQATKVALTPGNQGVSRLRRQMRAPLMVLLVMVSLLLLIACANIASLLLARGAARQRELAVRISIGAGRGRLVRQLLVESVMLALAGGALGLLVARWGTDAMTAQFGPTAIDAGLHVRVLAFAAGVSLVTGLLFGVLPALRAARVQPIEALGGSARGVHGPIGGPRRLPLGRVLVAVQLVVTVLLLSIAALFGRTLQQLAQVDLGFDTSQVVVASIDPLAAGYTPERLSGLYRALTERVSAAPGVVAASMSLSGPLSRSIRSSGLSVEGYQHGPDEQNVVQEQIVTVDYFRTLGLRVLRGRTFGPQDTAAGRPVTVINDTMARRFFKGRDPIGKRWSYDEDMRNGFEIVGVVSNARYNDLRTEIPNMAYRPAEQEVEFLGGLEVRTSGAPATVVGELRRLIGEVDPRLPILDVSTLTARAEKERTQERMLALLMTVFGIVALLLASLGLYGTIAYGVARRTSEIGVRMALGAGRRDVLWLVLREALIVVAAGLGIGLVASVWVASKMDRLLFNVSPADATSHLLAAAVLLSVAGLAAFLPARRAAALEPMSALRAE